MDEQLEMWNHLMSVFEEKIDPKSFKTWFCEAEFQEITVDNIFVIKVPTQFTANYLNKNYSPTIKEVAGKIFKDYFDIRFISNSPIYNIKQNTENETTPKEQLIKSKINSKYNFEQFIVGKSNNFAHSAAQAVAESPGDIYNPLFIYGESGMGKTHLMQAIGNFVIGNKKDDLNVYYITAEDFTNEMINSIQSKTTLGFRNRFRNIDLLLVDDIHFLAKKEATQEEFFHTFNALYEGKKQIVMTSDRPPKDIKDLESRLVTRFEWGLLADLKTPDFETRLAILRKKAETEEIVLRDEVFEFIAEHIYNSVRSLEGSLTRILAFSSCNNIEPLDIDREMCKNILSDIISDKVKEINLNSILDKVCAFYGLTPSQILDDTRKKNIAFPRQVAMYLSNLLIPQVSLQEIAKYYNRKDHTTVLHAKKVIDTHFKNDHNFRSEVEKIISELKK